MIIGKRGKLLLGLMAAFLAVPFLSGCGADMPPQEAAVKKPLEIHLWHYYNDAQKDGLDKIIAEYNDTVGREKGVLVEAVALGSIEDITLKVELAVDSMDGAAERPDMFLAYRDTLQEIQKSAPTELLDFQDYFTKEELEDYYSDFLTEGMFGDALYIMPAAKSTELLFMNQTLLDKFFAENSSYSAADFESWESIAKMAEAFYNWTDAQTPEVANNGKALIGIDSLSNYFITQNHSLGADIYETAADGSVTFELDEAAIKKLFSGYYIPYTKGYFRGAEKYCSDELRQDKLCGYAGSIASVAYFPETIYPKDESEETIKMGIYPYPGFADGKKTAIQQGAGIAALKGTEESNRAVADFIKWISGEKGMEYASLLSYMPTSRAAVENGEFDEIQEEKVKAAVMMGVEQVKTCDMVYGFDFEGAYDIRKEFEDYFKTILKDGRQEYLKYLAEGMSPEMAADAMNYDEKAQYFYDQIVEIFCQR